MYISEVRNERVIKTEIGSVVFDGQYDVLVSGLGTAGSMAAIMLAENGLKVLGVEAFNCVGGTATIGGLQTPYFDTPGGRYAAIDGVAKEHHRLHTRNIIESRKLEFERLILQRGAQIWYESSVLGIYMEHDTVVGARVITPEGIHHIKTKVILDATGDAYTVHMAGCATEYGRKFDGLAQPYSMVSSLRTGTGVRTTNCDFGRVDQRDDKGLSETLIFSRAYEMEEDRNGGRFMLHMPLIGIREGRRILAEEVVKLEDVFAERYTKEPMFYAYADLDKHGWDIAMDGTTLGDWAIGANLGAYNVMIPVSYKALIPKGVDGILVACRALGVDRDVATCVRTMPAMKRVAEAAADIATLAVRHGCALRDIPYAELRAMLSESGCLKKPYDSYYRIDGWKNYDGTPLVPENVTFMTEAEALEAKLATEKPGEAIWSAKRMGTMANETLKGLLHSADENTRKHAAFALAISGDDSGIEILRAMVKERDPLMLKDCRKHNQQRGCMAIYFLGRLADVEIADTLIEIFSDEDEIKRPAYKLAFAMGTRYKIKDFQNEYFQFISNAVIALIRIADAHPQLQKKTAMAFRAAFEDETYCKRITQRPPMSSEGGMARHLKKVAYAAIVRWGQ